MANSFTPIGSLCNNLHSFSLKQGLNALPDYRMVVGQDDAGRHGFSTLQCTSNSSNALNDGARAKRS
jgi:hypothetical protein